MPAQDEQPRETRPDSQEEQPRVASSSLDVLDELMGSPMNMDEGVRRIGPEFFP